jgi:hypothetical protein
MVDGLGIADLVYRRRCDAVDTEQLVRIRKNYCLDPRLNLAMLAREPKVWIGTYHFAVQDLWFQSSVERSGGC